jgi:glycosyltransferase involved in cell wall biosynthesis
LHRNRANVIQTIKTVAALEKLGVHVELVVPPWKSPTAVAERLKQLVPQKMPDIRASLLLHSNVRSWGLPFFCRWNKHRLLNADAVFARSPEISLALGKAKIPHCFEVHEASGVLKSSRYRQLLDFYHQGIIDRFFPISQAAADLLVAAGATPERMTICPCGVDLSAFQNIVPLVLEKFTLPTILYVGRISESRGLGIFRTLAERKLARVLLVGEQEDLVDEDPYIQVHPFVQHHEVPYWYAKADIVLLPYQDHLNHACSISPLKLFEAMASGRPIIASDIPSIREIIRHGENGLLVSSGDRDAWVSAVESLKRSPEFAAKLAQRALEDSKKYSWEERAKRIASALKKSE